LFMTNHDGLGGGRGWLKMDQAKRQGRANHV
jgi:hypothetical protein